ncbi:PREDICTED: uncharacterized protein LOC108381251 [Rhagoletis zephyria]|uniref:uncharacterized protein LOC108381251 n=1 Tax=Rhagoletis zephyria TaxID=28612 RepID=UPI000811512A|nr:PREDICTED: uncharacterized protein LOC108381251 [Rhagoletis zephyria]
MKETQLNLLRISFGVLSFLLYLKATTTATLTAAEWRQRTPVQTLAAQPRSNALQRNVRRLQPFTPTGQLAEAEAAHRHNDEHSALTKTLANTHSRFVRAADDAGGEADSGATSQWFSDNFGQMMQTLVELAGIVIGAIWRLFA